MYFILFRLIPIIEVGLKVKEEETKYRLIFSSPDHNKMLADKSLGSVEN